MKRNLAFKSFALGALLLSTLNPLFSSALAQGTAFTYQGRLSDNGTNFTGNAEFQPTLWDALSGGTQVAAHSPASIIVGVTNGLFVLPLDFGANFPGANRWLQLEVRTTNGPFTTLSPRQPITAAPYAVTASNLTGTLAAGQLSGTITSNQLAAGAVIAGKIADAAVGTAQIIDGTIRSGDLNLASFVTTFWKADGNSGTTAGANFIGTTDNQPLEFKVNNARALRIELNGGAPTLIGGYSGNSSGGFVGGTIAGGGAGSATNKLGGNWATVGGGHNNQAMGFYATVAGGRENLATNFYASANGGYRNLANGQGATVGGGENNSASGTGSTVAGGSTNSANSRDAVIGGGRANTIETSADNSVIAGGWGNIIQDSSLLSTISGGISNNIAANTENAIIAGGELNTIGMNSSNSVIGGGFNNTIANNSPGATIVGGVLNNVGANVSYSVISGGGDNHIDDRCRYASIAGGSINTIGTNGDYSAIGGGNFNTIANDAEYATVPGGQNNVAGADYSFAAGFRAKADHRGSFVWADSGNFDFHSSVQNGFFARSVGGVKFVTGIDGSGNETAGVRLVAGANAWSTLSDRDAKKNFSPVNAEAILEKLAAMPVQSWNYKWESETNTPHLGPMAQDFKAAFYPGRDDKSISTLEFDGVELAAIQGLNQKLEEELRRRDAENAELRQRLEKLEHLLDRSAGAH
jgi:hypothetical protein